MSAPPKLTYAQSEFLRRIPVDRELLIVGAGWPDYFAVEPDQIEPEIEDPNGWRCALGGVHSPTVEALIAKGALVLRREAFDRTKRNMERGWVRRWYQVTR